MKRATIKDIAEKARCDASTVSLALNRHPRIPVRTRDRIIAIARKLDYRPNAAARALAGGKTGTIAVACISFASWFEMTLLRGIEKKLAHSNLSMIQFATGGDREKEKSMVASLLNGGLADGLIGISFDPGAKGAAMIKKEGYPFVSIGARVPGACSVTFNDYKGAYLAGNRLLESGRKNLAIISPKVVRGYTSPDVEQRVKGFMDAVSGKTGASVRIVETEDINVEDGVKACEAIRGYSGIDGVFCAAGDSAAIGFAKHARRAGISIPGDIALIGYDDNEMASAITPELTTVRQPVEQAGETACSALLGIIEGKTQKGVVFEPGLTIRESG